MRVCVRACACACLVICSERSPLNRWVRAGSKADLRWQSLAPPPRCPSALANGCHISARGRTAAIYSRIASSLSFSAFAARFAARFAYFLSNHSRWLSCAVESVSTAAARCAAALALRVSRFSYGSPGCRGRIPEGLAEPGAPFATAPTRLGHRNPAADDRGTSAP